MEPPPEFPPSKNSPQPGAPGGGATGSTRPGMVPAPRRYPKPPAFLPRFVMLCLRPETWPEAARYPTFVTLLPLIFAILLGATAMGAGDALRLLTSLDTFAGQYAALGYPPLDYHHDGTLSSTGPLPAPIRVPFATAPELVVQIDPTGTTKPETVKAPGYFVTNKEVVMTGDMPNVHMTLADLIPVPAEGQTDTFNGTTLKAYLTGHGGIFVVCGLFLIAAHAMAQSLWVILMLFILSPMVMIAAAGLPSDSDSPRRRLLLPRRAAVRMVAGLLVPIVMADSISRALDYGVAQVVGIQWTMGVWLLVCAGLAIWTGIMANHMYLPQQQARRGH